MKRDLALVISSLLTITLGSIHFAQDFFHGMMDGSGLLVGSVILFVALFITVVWPDRRWSQVVIFLFGLLSAAMPVFHNGPKTPTYGLDFAWVLVAIGATGLLTAALAVRALLTKRASS